MFNGSILTAKKIPTPTVFFFSFVLVTTNVFGVGATTQESNSISQETIDRAMEKLHQREDERARVHSSNTPSTIPATSGISTINDLNNVEGWPDDIRKRRDEQLAIFVRQVNDLDDEMSELSKWTTIKQLGGQYVREHRKEVSQNCLLAKTRAEAFKRLNAQDATILFKQMDEVNAKRVQSLRKVYGDARTVGEQTIRQLEAVLECHFSKFAVDVGETEFAVPPKYKEGVVAKYTIQYRTDSDIVAATDAKVELVKVTEGCWAPRALIINDKYCSFNLDDAAYYWEVGWDGKNFFPVQRK